MEREKLDKIIKIIKERTAVTSYSLKINEDKKPDIFGTKIGGMPYWDKTKEYPTSEKGDKLALLAQINLADLPPNNVFPSKGMFQFYFALTDDYCYGMDFDKGDSQKNFRVIYHENIDSSFTEKDAKDMDIPNAAEDDNGFSPIYGEYALDIEEKTAYITPDTYEFEELYNNIKKELGDTTEDSLFNQLEDDDYDYLYDELQPTGHRMLGYPYFTQFDPREQNEELRRYDTLLLQIDSEGTDKYDYVLWGDMGVGNFFINSQDLKDKRFDRILYNWDCG